MALNRRHYIEVTTIVTPGIESCGYVNELEGDIFPSLKRRGGGGINKKTRSHRSGADGVGSSGEILRPEQFRRTDTPGRAASELDHFLMARPPLLFKEGNSAHLNTGNL